MIFKNYGDFLHTDQNLTSYNEQKALVYFQSSATNSMYKNPLQCWKKFTRIWLWLKQDQIFCIRTSHDLIWWKLLEAMYLAKSNYIITSNIIKYNMLTSNHVPVKLLASCLFLKYRESNLLVYKSNAIFPLGDILK